MAGLLDFGQTNPAPTELDILGLGPPRTPFGPDAIADLYRAVNEHAKRAGQPGLAPASPIWNLDNPVGTESVGGPEMRTASPDFVPAKMVAGGAWGPERPVSQADIDKVEAGSQWLFDEAAMMAPGGSGPRVPGAPVTAARVRTPRTPMGPRRASAGYTTVDPAAPNAPEAQPEHGLGHNKPPAGSEIWAAPPGIRDAPQVTSGRMGSNADTQLADLGLPDYAAITPSTNRGPVAPDAVKAGSPVRPGNVFDLSETYRVPDMPQTELPRIDPDAGRRKGLPEHIVQATTDPDMRAKLRTVAEEGLKVGGAYWYNAEPLRHAFVAELGPEAGNATFEKYMRTVGAVSAGSDVGQNIRTASYYNVRERQGNPVQGIKLPGNKGWAPSDIESPYGHKMQNTQYSAYQDIAGGDPLDPEIRPKRASFDANLSGNQEPVTVDKHNLRLIGMLSQNPEFLNTTIKADVNYPSIGVAKGDSINFKQAYKDGRLTMDQLIQIPQAWKDVPEPQHYGALEGFQKDLAKEMNITPAQLQAALWVGGGRVTGLRSLPTSFMGAFENRLQTTAAKRGGTATEALMDFLHARQPLLTPLLAATGAGAAGSGLLGPAADENRR